MHSPNMRVQIRFIRVRVVAHLAHVRLNPQMDILVILQMRLLVEFLPAESARERPIVFGRMFPLVPDERSHGVKDGETNFAPDFFVVRFNMFLHGGFGREDFSAFRAWGFFADMIMSLVLLKMEIGWEGFVANVAVNILMGLG